MPDADLPPVLSAVIITRNDEPALRACLASICDHVDEIVVCVDTRVPGDATASARDFTDHVHTDPFPLWMDDPPRVHFADARNQAHAHATGDWCLVIDADELLEEAGLLRTAVARAHTDGFDAVAVRVDCWSDEGLGESYLATRLFRRTESIRWTFPVHNRLVGVRRVLESPCVIRSSYEGDGVLAAKARRAIPALRRLHDEAASPEERVHAAFYLCRSYSTLEDDEQVIRWGAVCRDLCPDEPAAASFWYALAMAVSRSEGFEAGVRLVDEALEHHPEFADLWHLRTTFDFVRWFHHGTRGTRYRSTQHTSWKYLANAHAAAGALGLPVTLPLPRSDAPAELPAPPPSGRRPVLWVLTTLWRRPALTAVTLRHYAGLRADLAEHIDLRLLAVGSEGEVSRAPAERHGWQYVEHANRPLGAKHNALLDVVRDSGEADAVLIIGSDDFLAADYVLRCASDIASGAAVVGLADLAFLDAARGRAVRWPGYVGTLREGEPVGAGRCISRRALEAVNWRLWDDHLDSGLDGSMWARLCAVRSLGRVVVHRLADGYPAFDVKASDNIVGFETIAGAEGVEALPDDWVRDHFGAELADALAGLASSGA